MTRCLLAWSSGKDCAFALHALRGRTDLEVVGLLTTLNEQYDRVAMHAVRRELVVEQARAVGLELWPIELPWPCPNEVYERLMRDAMDRARSRGVTAVVFGDLFLEDVREYRERQLGEVGMKAIFPLWGRPTAELAREMISSGFRARVTCVDPGQLDERFAGRDLDEAFLDELPEGVDPCGENGEFHTFVHDGPVFERPIAIRSGEVVTRDGFVFADVLPARLTDRDGSAGRSRGS